MSAFVSRLFAAAVLTGITVNAGNAHAQDSGVAYAGGGVGDGRNVYAGAVVALPGASLGDGPALRGGLAGGEYRYDTNGQRVRADYASAELALVWQSSGEWGWASFGAGPRLTWTDTHPRDPGNDRQGTKLDAALSTDGALGYRWRLGWFGSFGVSDQSYIGELRFGPLVDDKTQTRAGVEGAFQGDDSYERLSAGVFVSTQFAPSWEGRLSGGFSDMKGRDPRPYAAISVSRLF